MGFSVFRTVMTAAICLFLVLLFVLPSCTLRRFSGEADSLIRAALDCLERGDAERARGFCASLSALVSERMPALERFLNHADIDALDAAVAVAGCAVRVGDAGAAAEALAEAGSILARIRGIELFSWNSLL